MTGNQLPRPLFDQWVQLQHAFASALDNRDERAVIQLKAEIQAFATLNHIDLSQPVSLAGTPTPPPSPPPTPIPTPTPTPPPTTGNLVLPPGIMHGAMTDPDCHEDGNGALVKAFNALALKPLAVCYFTDNWYNGINFPATKAASIRDAGAVPFIRMQIWQREGNSLKDLGTHTHANIAAGMHDAALKAYAQAAKAHGSLIFIQYCVEVNGNWFPWFIEGPAAYKTAFKHIIGLFRAEGAHNVKWCFQVDATENDKGVDWYPGDDYIDMIGSSVYGTYGYGQKGCASELAKCWPHFSAISAVKPLGIFEWGQSDATDTTSALSAVLDPKYARIRLMQVWHEKLCDPSDPYPPDGRINANAANLKAYQTGIANPHFTSTNPSLA